jgi:hypothetical protein
MTYVFPVPENSFPGVKSSRAVFSGNFKRDKRKGKGILKFYNGDVVEGMWLNDYV